MILNFPSPFYYVGHRIPTSSPGGAIGKQFNPEGSIGQIGKKIGGPFSKDEIAGSQFDASKSGIAGTVEKAVDGLRNSAEKE